MSDVSYARVKSSLLSTCGVWSVPGVVEFVQSQWRMVSERFGESCR